MASYRNRFGPHNPDETYVAHDVRRAARRPRRGADELRRRRRRVAAGAAADPRPDRVVVGLRAGAAAARRALPGVRRRPPRPGTLDAHARALHARQHGQRPRALHRHRDRPPDDRQRAVVGWRARRRGCRPTPSPGQVVAAHYEDPPLFASEVEPGDRPGHPPGHRRHVPAVEHVPRRPVEHRRLGRHRRRRARRPARMARRPRHAAGGAAAEPQGVRPGMGPRVLDRHRRRVLRPRAHAAVGEGAGAAHASLPPRRRRPPAC